MREEPDISIELAGIRMKNPVMVTSGTFGYGEEFAQLIDLNKLGAVVLKSITLEPRVGNAAPRTVETPSGMLNAIGLENVGVEALIEEKLPYLRQFDLPVIVSIAGETIDEYVRLARRLNDIEGISGIEVNISCPNVKSRFQERLFSQDARATYKVTSKVRRATSFPLIVKLSPNVTDITQIARAAADGGTDILSLVNTIAGMAVNVEDRRPELANITGGLSGPAIKPIALRMVWEVAQKAKIPIIGMGGIMSAQDAIEFIICGASAVGIGTANFVDPQIPLKIIEGMKAYLEKNKIANIRDLVGSLKC